MNYSYLIIVMLLISGCSKKSDTIIDTPALPPNTLQILDYCYQSNNCFGTETNTVIRFKNYSQTEVEFCDLMLFNTNPSPNYFFTCAINPIGPNDTLTLELDQIWVMLSGDIVRLYEIINSKQTLLDEVTIK
jgi:hypothetical protein